MKTWKQTISPLLKKYKSDTDKVFSAYNKEVKSKKLTSISDTNTLWRSKYAAKLDKIDKAHDIAYKKVWTEFHKA